MSLGNETNSSDAIQLSLNRLRAGQDDASHTLMAVAMDRLRLLSRKILADISGVKRWESTDDLLQNASLRLWRALDSHRPPTPVDFFRLAACVIRRELIDLSRSHFGPEGWGANLRSPQPTGEAGLTGPLELAPSHDTHNPEKLLEWTEFHTYVDNLPDDQRQLFDLLWYQGLTMAETSDLLQIPLRTLGRAWKKARVDLTESLLGNLSDA